jgi:hypothetical protein
MAEKETQERMAAYFVDLRLPPAERAKLAARSAAFSSRAVNTAFNRMQSEALKAIWVSGKSREGAAMAGRVGMGAAVDDLNACVRSEMGSDDRRAW